MDVKKITRLAVLCGLSVVLVWLIHFPIIPAAPFLEYDPADICILIAGLSYGTGAGLLTTVIVSVIQGMTVSVSSGWIGVLMHILSTGVFVSVSSLAYKKQGLGTALFWGAVSMVIAMIPINLVFTGIFMGAGTETVAKMLMPAIIPFNAIKAGINAVLTGIIFKNIRRIM